MSICLVVILKVDRCCSTTAERKALVSQTSSPHIDRRDEEGFVFSGHDAPACVSFHAVTATVGVV